MSLLTIIDRYLHAARMPVTTFGRRAVGDPRLVLDLRRGRQPGPDMCTRIQRFIGEHQA